MIRPSVSFSTLYFLTVNSTLFCTRLTQNLVVCTLGSFLAWDSLTSPTKISSSNENTMEDEATADESLIDKAEFEQLKAEFREQLRADRAKIIAEIKLSFDWLKGNNGGKEDR